MDNIWIILLCAIVGYILWFTFNATCGTKNVEGVDFETYYYIDPVDGKKRCLRDPSFAPYWINPDFVKRGSLSGCDS